MTRLNHPWLMALSISTYQSTSWESDILRAFHSLLVGQALDLSGCHEGHYRHLQKAMLFVGEL